MFHKIQGLQDVSAWNSTDYFDICLQLYFVQVIAKTFGYDKHGFLALYTTLALISE